MLRSRPTRGAWIETFEGYQPQGGVQSRPTRGAWIETDTYPDKIPAEKSRPTRGAWIETLPLFCDLLDLIVAPHTGRVD